MEVEDTVPWVGNEWGMLSRDCEQRQLLQEVWLHMWTEQISIDLYGPVRFSCFSGLSSELDYKLIKSKDYIFYFFHPQHSDSNFRLEDGLLMEVVCFTKKQYLLYMTELLYYRFIPIFYTLCVYITIVHSTQYYIIIVVNIDDIPVSRKETETS